MTTPPDLSAPVIRRIVITAGPTREPLDPVRFLSNYATGALGYALAGEAVKRGYAVTLVSGPTHLRAPSGVRLVRVETAGQMYRATRRAFVRADCLIMTAAVSDWRVRRVHPHKIKKTPGGKAPILHLVENADILASLAARKQGRFVIGFALESKRAREYGVRKMRRKGADMLIVNTATGRQRPFGQKGVFSYTIIIPRDTGGHRAQVVRGTKKRFARWLIAYLRGKLRSRIGKQ